MVEDRNTYGTPARVVDAAQNKFAPRRTPTGKVTEKAYFNTGEQICEGDVVLYVSRDGDVRRVDEVQSGARSGDPENPSVKCTSGKTSQASLLTLQRRKGAPVPMHVPAAVPAPAPVHVPPAVPAKDKEEAANGGVDEEMFKQVTQQVVDTVPQLMTPVLIVCKKQ